MHRDSLRDRFYTPLSAQGISLATDTSGKNLTAAMDIRGSKVLRYCPCAGRERDGEIQYKGTPRPQYFFTFPKPSDTSTEPPCGISKYRFLPHDHQQQPFPPPRLATASPQRTLSLDRHDPAHRRKHTQTSDSPKVPCRKHLHCHDWRYP